jgi:hypothetical protein
MKSSETNKRPKDAIRIPGFWDGVATVLGMTAPIESDQQSDMEAMMSDWENVGNDMRTAMSKFATR